MLLLKIYIYHLYFRVHWLWNLCFHYKSIERLHMNQVQLLTRVYGDLAVDLPYRESLRGKEFKIYSQNGEDGILLYIFSQIGVTNRTFVEFGIETGRECNTAALIQYFGWRGLMMDGNGRNIRKARKYYTDSESYRNSQLKISQCFVTSENINRVIEAHGISGEIDLLSIDIDGNDYWIWEAIDVITPRVVVIEYNASFGNKRSITVPYDPAFQRFEKHKSGWYHGASLIALEAIGRKKQYHLIGADSNGCNAFFVRYDVCIGDLQELPASEAYYPQPKRNQIASLEQQFALIENLDYVVVPTPSQEA